MPRQASSKRRKFTPEQKAAIVPLCANKFETTYPSEFSVEGEQAIIRAETHHHPRS